MIVRLGWGFLEAHEEAGSQRRGIGLQKNVRENIGREQIWTVQHVVKRYSKWRSVI